MERLESFELVLDALKHGEFLTVNGYDRFFQKGDIITYLCNGSSFKLKIDDFKAIYHKDTFYVYEDNNVFIDNDKDEDYYRYYKK